MEFQEDQDLEDLVEKKGLQDQLERLDHLEVKEQKDQKASEVLMVFQVELAQMVNQEIKDDLVDKVFVDLQVLLGHLDHQDVCAII